MNSKKGLWIDLGIVVLMGMVPLFWFMKGHYILSVDFTLPFTWTRWLNEYFHSWNQHLGAGICYRLIEATHFFFLLQIFFQKIGLDLLATERAVFVFWYLVPGLSFFGFARYLFRDLPETGKRMASLVAVSFYMFNLYLEPIWIGFNVSNLSAYAFVPLLLWIWFVAIEKKKNPVLYGFLFALITFGASGVFCNPAILILSIVPFVFFTVLALFRLKPGLKDLLRTGWLIFFTLLFTVGFNTYWLLIETFRIFFNPETRETALSSGLILKPWLEGVSKFTSFYNVIRMQGDWTWYAGYRSYAPVFHDNWFFIFLSWMLPALGIVGLTVKNRYRFFFGVLLIGSLFFSMGVHSFFAPVYLWCVDHLPFFWVIRSPWYKFGFLTCFGYAFFLGLAAYRITGWVDKFKWKEIRFGKRFRFKMSFIAFVLLFLYPPLYAYPFTLGKHFIRPKNGGYTNHVKVPDYVYEAADWVNGKEGNFRIFDLPGKGFWHNRWGFQGFTPFGSYVFDQPMLYIDQPVNLPKQSTWTTPWSHPTILIVNALEKELSPNLHRFMSLFNVNTLLFEKDYKFETLPLPKKPEEFEANLRRQYGIHFKKSFGGKWDLYNVDEALPPVYFTSQTVYVGDHIDTFIPLSNLEEMGKKAYFFSGLTTESERKKLFGENLINETVLHDNTFFDMAVDFVPAAKELFIPKKEENPERRIAFEVEKEGSYILYSRKKFPFSFAVLRPLVDLTPFPQEIDIPWKQQSEKGEGFTWFDLNGQTAVPAGETGLISGKFSGGEQWLSLGHFSLKKGENHIQIRGEEADQAQYRFKLVDPDSLALSLRRFEEGLIRPDVSWRYYLTTNSAWSHNATESVASNPLVPSENIQWNVGEGLRESFPFKGDSGWRRLNEKKEALRILNRSDKRKTVLVYLELYIAQDRERTLYVNLNGKQTASQSLNPQKRLNLLLPLRLKPGENQVVFTTNGRPVKLDKLFGDGDNREANFLIQNISVGDKVFKGTFYLPESREAMFRVYPFKDPQGAGPEWTQKRRVLILDGKPLELISKTQSSGSRYWQGKTALNLENGEHRVEFKEIDGNGYFIEVFAPGAALSGYKSTPLTYKRVNPTEAKGEFQNATPGWFIFCEAFDPRWEMDIHHKIIKPFLVNGYANAYFIDTPAQEAASFRLFFSIQRYLYQGLAVSGVFFGGALILVLLVLLFRRRK